MPLSCECDYGDCDWYYEIPDDYSTFDKLRRKRCSCGSLIERGALCLKFRSWRSPGSDIEERIHGDEVPMASKYLCERCADLYFSLSELGFDCVSPNESMMELVREYAEFYQCKPSEVSAASGEGK